MGSHVNYMTLVPFNGEKGEWIVWSAKFLARATLCGYRGVLNGTETVPKWNQKLIQELMTMKLKSENITKYLTVI